MAMYLVRIFCHMELMQCSTVKSKNGKPQRPAPNATKLAELLGMCMANMYYMAELYISHL